MKWGAWGKGWRRTRRWSATPAVQIMRDCVANWCEIKDSQPSVAPLVSKQWEIEIDYANWSKTVQRKLEIIARDWEKNEGGCAKLVLVYTWFSGSRSIILVTIYNKVKPLIMGLWLLKLSLSNFILLQHFFLIFVEQPWKGHGREEKNIEGTKKKRKMDHCEITHFFQCASGSVQHGNKPNTWVLTWRSWLNSLATNYVSNITAFAKVLQNLAKVHLWFFCPPTVSLPGLRRNIIVLSLPHFCFGQGRVTGGWSWWREEGCGFSLMSKSLSLQVAFCPFQY